MKVRRMAGFAPPMASPMSFATVFLQKPSAVKMRGARRGIPAISMTSKLGRSVLHENRRILTKLMLLSVLAMLSLGPVHLESAHGEDLLSSVMSIIETKYPFDVNMEEIRRAAASAALRELKDPFSSLILREQADPLVKSSAFLSDGSALGLGAAIVKDSRLPDRLTVTSVFESSPAEKAGLRTGDVITRIEGKDIGALTSLEELSAMVSQRGAGAIELEVRRPGLARAVRIEAKAREGATDSPSVPLAFTASSPGGRIGYLKLKDMGPTSPLEAEAALQDILRESEGDLKGIVVDLRDNPGGLLSSAVEVASLFLPEGTPIVDSCLKKEDLPTDSGAGSGHVARVCPENTVTERYFTSKNRLSAQNAKTKVALIVNSATRSSAEILAAAFQDLDRAVIVGEETYGKASAQQIVKLGPKDIVRLTTSFLLSPSGRSISKFSSPQHQTEVGGQFTTLHRRPVSEGSGVQPGVQVKANKGGRVGDLLTLRGVYFDFASLWCHQHGDLVARSLEPSSASDVVSAVRRSEDQIWTSFTAFVSDFLKTSEALDPQLAKDLEKDGMQTALRTLALLAEAERHDLEALLQTNRKEIQVRLHDAILTRFLKNSERLLASLDVDAAYSEAVQVLSSERYETILRGSDQEERGRREESQGDPKKYRPAIAGYDRSALCLAGQTCNNNEYVYVKII